MSVKKFPDNFFNRKYGKSWVIVEEIMWGLKRQKEIILVILNPDTLVDPNWIKELILAYEKYGDGLYQPKFLTTTDHNTLMSTGNMIHLIWFWFLSWQR